MEEELSDLRRQGIFRVEQPPLNGIPLKTRFVFKIKRSIDEKIEQHKASFVTRGFTQQSRMNFLETFSSVIDFDAMRVARG